MAKPRTIVDYSSLSLPEIIKRKGGGNSAFCHLEPDFQLEILKYIKKHNIEIDVFGEKWYDILSNKFYAIKYSVDDSDVKLETEKISFDSFATFFNVLHGEIYDNSCFFGYVFSPNEVDEFQLKTEFVNFDSFISETIDKHSFEEIIATKSINNSDADAKAGAMGRFVKRLRPINTLSALERIVKRFSNQFDVYAPNRLFFSLLLSDPKRLPQEIAIQYLCKNDIYGGLSFWDIILVYGKTAASQVFDGFKQCPCCSRQTIKRRISSFKYELDVFEDSSIPKGRITGFDSHYRLYYAKAFYLYEGHRYCVHDLFFETFDEFVSFLGGNLCGSDLRDAPIERSQVLKYVTDEKTVLPLPKLFERHETIKVYEGELFYVTQKWFDDKGLEILSDTKKFDKFFDFFHFLKGDLSHSDLIMCDGIENLSNLTGLNLSDARVRSVAAKALGLPFNHVHPKRLETISFEATNKRELLTIDAFLSKRPFDEDYSKRISYISDIHLQHRFLAYKCETADDLWYVIRKLSGTLAEQSTEINFVCGDTSSDINSFEAFVMKLAAYKRKGHFFFVLGNHELWPFDQKGSGSPEDLQQYGLTIISQKYKQILAKYSPASFSLLQNNLFYLEDQKWIEISEGELSSLSPEHIRERTKKSLFTVFGGIGFAGMNKSFNAESGIYRGVIDRENEIVESKKFLGLYKKVVKALHGRNLVVATHMPMRDWGGNIKAEEGVIYINGHSHHNYYEDDGKTRIYADNQIGYSGKNLSLKQVAVDFNYDWFEDYDDGIFEITREDYQNYYRGIGETLMFERTDYQKLYLIKREATYMFLMSTEKGNLYILSGGAIKKVGEHSLEYFYEHLSEYAASIRMFLSDYDTFQKNVAKAVKLFGGEGKIHGSIVDIDFFTHLYLNPFDYKITPYFAYSIGEKYVYKNIPSLLKNQCPELYSNYRKLVNSSKMSRYLVPPTSDNTLSNNVIFVGETDMYGISRVLKGLQYTTNYNVVRLWNDSIIGFPSPEKGRLIVSGIIKNK